jgi:hypothetical protein
VWTRTWRGASGEHCISGAPRHDVLSGAALPSEAAPSPSRSPQGLISLITRSHRPALYHAVYRAAGASRRSHAGYGRTRRSTHACATTTTVVTTYLRAVCLARLGLGGKRSSSSEVFPSLFFLGKKLKSEACTYARSMHAMSSRATTSVRTPSGGAHTTCTRGLRARCMSARSIDRFSTAGPGALASRPRLPDDCMHR